MRYSRSNVAGRGISSIKIIRFLGYHTMSYFRHTGSAAIEFIALFSRIGWLLRARGICDRCEGSERRLSADTTSAGAAGAACLSTSSSMLFLPLDTTAGKKLFFYKF